MHQNVVGHLLRISVVGRHRVAERGIGHEQRTRLQMVEDPSRAVALSRGAAGFARATSLPDGSVVHRDQPAAGPAVSAAAAAGILIPPSQFEAWFISLAHNQDDIERTIKAAAA